MNFVIENIETEEAPIPIAPYSQATIAGAVFSLSGQIGIDPQTKRLVEEGTESELFQVIRNIKAIKEKGHNCLKELGIYSSKVNTETTVFFRNKSDLEILKKNCKPNFPKRIDFIEVGGLPLNASVEIRTEDTFPKFFNPKDYYSAVFIDRSNGFEAIKDFEDEIKGRGFGLQRVFYAEAHLGSMSGYGNFNGNYAPMFSHRPSRAVVQLQDFSDIFNLRLFCKAYLGRLDG